jgi:hypothetical protein
VSISPATTNTTVGSQFTVIVSVANVTDFFGAAFDIIYNPAVLNFVSAQKGNFLEQDGASTFLTSAANPPGDLMVGYSRMANNGVPTGISGSGNFMVTPHTPTNPHPVQTKPW